MNSPYQLKRASAVIESAEPNINRDYITFLKNKNQPKAENSFLDFSENDSFDNSFIKQDNINKKYINTPSKKNSKKFPTTVYKLEEPILLINEENTKKITSTVLKIEEPSLHINEDNLFFENILRKKLLKSLEKKFAEKTLIHLDALVFPVPKDPKNLKKKLYYDSFKYKLFEELQGKFKFFDMAFEYIKAENIISMVNIEKEFTKRKENSGNSDKLYVGINTKKINKKTYFISYMYAEEI